MTDERTSTGTPAATVLICDERPVARRELTTQLASGAAKCRVTAIGDGTRLIEEFCACPAGVVLIGVHRGDHAGTAAMDMLLDRHPGAHVIVYGGVHDSALLATAMTRGAHGLVIWDIGQRLTPRPLLGNGHGNLHAPNTGGGQRNGPPLTERELQILHGMSNGQANGAIGRELFISEDTVKTHARRLFNKIGAVDRAHAVAIGLRTGLL